MAHTLFQDERFGSGAIPGVVGADLDATGRTVTLWIRDGDTVYSRQEAFQPFCWIESPSTWTGCPIPCEIRELSGTQPFRALASFDSWKDHERALAWLRRSADAGEAPFLAIPDPVQQYFMRTGVTFFRGLSFSEVRRLQIDIETRTTEGYDFPNADREGDRILAIGLSDSTGWERLISAREYSESDMIEEAVRSLRERDPDVIEGHNLFAFDLPYLMKRARRAGVSFGVGRDGSEPSVRSGRFTAADRTTSYPRADLTGRSIVDTYFLAQLYDVSHRSLPGLGLKEVARHFGLAREGRVRVDVGHMDQEFERDPDRVLAYLSDDLSETRALGELLSPVIFEQARLLPFGYQSVGLRGSTAKIDAWMLREYLRWGGSVPRPEARRSFEGGAADIFFTGVARPVHHCDVRSLYPSLMLAERIGPASDEAGVFLALLGRLREFRLQAKSAMQKAANEAERQSLDSMQSAFKILINSFYGYLGFDQARFSDFSAAERVTARGREILSGMLAWIRAHGGSPVEMDTDGIYFVPPPGESPEDRIRFREGLATSLPPGIDVEFDGEYPAMFSYKVKNYALLCEDGEILLKGAALKSRGLEPFQRKFIREAVELHLRGESRKIPECAERYRKAIRNREWPIRELARSERLQDHPEAYADKKANGRARNAAYELALASGRTYRAGDTVRYYVTGERSGVAVHENSRMISEWDPLHRDENVAYYLTKLNALVKKFGSPDGGAAPVSPRQEQQEMML
ncbi:MAG: DNA polymerase domain-containing protein [Kiritimatiellia bacterium]|nr:DNA polymerase domain-containing protein [Kiritimatiellia bacterium]